MLTSCNGTQFSFFFHSLHSCFHRFMYVQTHATLWMPLGKIVWKYVNDYCTTYKLGCFKPHPTFRLSGSLPCSEILFQKLFPHRSKGSCLHGNPSIVTERVSVIRAQSTIRFHTPSYPRLWIRQRDTRIWSSDPLPTVVCFSAHHFDIAFSFVLTYEQARWTDDV